MSVAARSVLAEERVRHAIAGSPDPERAADYLQRLLECDGELCRRLVSMPAGLQSLIAIFCHSYFLSDEVLRSPAWLEPLLSSDALFKPSNAEMYAERLSEWCGAGMPVPAQLSRFRRRELARILLRDVRGLAMLSDVTSELSALADAMLDVIYQRVRRAMEERYGAPMNEDGRRCGLSILALGKLGGEELNYSSDLDLMFVYGGAGETTGPQRISHQEFFSRVAREVTQLLSSHSEGGLCYRIDLRLRPDGKLGEICLPLASAKAYYEARGRDWELQMLIKARVAAGEAEPGRELLKHIEPLIYRSTLNFSAVEAVSETRTRIHERLARRRLGRDEIDVKLSQGGIRDIEFLVQCLQRLHGGREKWVRHGGTLLALLRLRDKSLLSPVEYARLASAYQFLRNVEHRLQFAEDLQTHALPAGGPELENVARRMPPSLDGLPMTADLLIGEVRRHLSEVADIYERVIHAQRPRGQDQASGAALSHSLRLVHALMPAQAKRVGAMANHQVLTRLEHFLEQARQLAPVTRALEDEIIASRTIDVIEHSPYLAEELQRNPALVKELDFSRGVSDPPPGVDAAGLRRWFRREMFRSLSAGLCIPEPVFKTLEDTSRLAEKATSAAYQIALKAVSAAHAPESMHYRPRKQMMVIALGRLGVQEFDLGSDADLVFVIPTRDAPEMRFWTRVAEKMIEVISAYTGEGSLFAVDTRLRPNGREGALVQTEQSIRDYFDSKAEAWEGMAYMKSHAVAGDKDRAVEFLNALQEVDWRRYGQSGRSRNDLRKMRQRLQKELGESNPLKAGEGGYYDIDFVLMYLRLKSAGIFFKQLNTPKRIDVVEKMGHLERAEAAFLMDAAVFYRAMDHGLRLIHGHAEGKLPRSQADLDALTALKRRWAPAPYRDRPLRAAVDEIRTRTRQVFDRLFP
jgi:glutamate-ammonia-ligase adenylyltransferase